MPNDLAEQVLRATANAMTKSTETVEEQSAKFGEYASSHANRVGSTIEANAVELAIAAAVGVIAISYFAVSSQLSAEKKKRLSYDRERIAGIATFTVPRDKIETELYLNQRVIKDFMELTSQKANESFSTYLGIQRGTPENNKTVDFYSVLPFYRLSEQLDQPAASRDLLDQERKNIRLFFSSAFPETIADLDNDFLLADKVCEFFKSTFEQSDYLNDRAAPRFIMMSLANLLWNLQHPVDSDGFPLTVNQCIDLCDLVDTYLNELLRAGTPELSAINSDENQLLSFVRKVKTHTSSLKRAYADKQAHELNLEDIANSAHRSLRIMDNNIYKLIYKRHNPLTGKDKPDGKAAEDMAYRVSYLNDLLIEQPQLLATFDRFCARVPVDVQVNKPATNVMDALIIFCHLPRIEKNKLLAALTNLKIDAALESAQTLTKLDQKFIHPIKVLTKKSLKGKSWTDPDRFIVASNTAARLLPLITLVIEDFRIAVDSAESTQAAKASKEAQAGVKIYSGDEQVKAINQDAATTATYYKWDLPFLLECDADTAKALQGLPKQQYRMTQVTQLLDNLSQLVQRHRGFLRHAKFQQFVKGCLENIANECTTLLEKLTEMDKCLKHDNIMRLNLLITLNPMMKQLKDSLNAFAIAGKHAEQVLNLPSFTEQEKEAVGSKISAIHQQYSSLFGEDSGISALIDENHAKVAVGPPAVLVDIPVSTCSVLALRDLVQRCRDGLSWQSQCGHKGQLLDDLLMDINHQPNFTNDHIKKVIMCLVRVTASYRQTIFAQAAYGQTRSAQTLIAAVKDKKLNKVLPLASIVFGRAGGIDVGQLRDVDIQKRLTRLQFKYQWEKASDDIKARLVFG